MSRAMVFHRTAESSNPEFDELFRQYYAMVYRTAVSVTGSHEDAEDVVQTIFLRLFRSGLPPGFGDNPKGYLYRAAVNASLTNLRSRRRRVYVADDQLEILAGAGLPPKAASPMQQRLVDAIAQLNPKAVELLILRYEHHYSDAEIAKLLGKSRGVIAVGLYRARARLKKLLRATGDSHETK